MYATVLHRIFMTANEIEIWCEWAQPYKTIAKFIVHSIIIKHRTLYQKSPIYNTA